MATVFARLDAKAGYQCQHQRFVGLGVAHECFEFIIKVLIVAFGYFIFRTRELHLANVDGLVGAIYDKVDLRSLIVLGGGNGRAACPALHTCNTQCILDLRKVKWKFNNWSCMPEFSIPVSVKQAWSPITFLIRKVLPTRRRPYTTINSDLSVFMYSFRSDVSRSRPINARFISIIVSWFRNPDAKIRYSKFSVFSKTQYWKLLKRSKNSSFQQSSILKIAQTL